MNFAWLGFDPAWRTALGVDPLLERRPGGPGFAGPPGCSAPEWPSARLAIGARRARGARAHPVRSSWARGRAGSLGVAHQLLDAGLVHVAGAAEHLHGVGGGRHRRIGWRRSSRRAPAPRRGRRRRRPEPHRHRGEHVAHGVVFDDRHAALMAGVCVLERHRMRDGRPRGRSPRCRPAAAPALPPTRPARRGRRGASEPAPVEPMPPAAARSPSCATSRSSFNPGARHEGEPRVGLRRASTSPSAPCCTECSRRRARERPSEIVTSVPGGPARSPSAPPRGHPHAAPQRAQRERRWRAARTARYHRPRRPAPRGREQVEDTQPRTVVPLARAAHGRGRARRATPTA